MNHDPGHPGTKLIMRGIMAERLDREDPLTITISADTENAGSKHVASSLAAEIVAGFGPREESPLSIIANAGGSVAGGLNGSSHWGWCYIRHLWVQADWRHRGLGRRLLAEAEIQARARHCVGLYVDTFDPGAVLFYERAGFERFGRIEDFPLGHARTFLCRRLRPGGGSEES